MGTGVMALHDLVDARGQDLPLAREQGAEGPAAPQAVVVRQLHGMAQQADVFLFLHGDGWAIGS